MLENLAHGLVTHYTIRMENLVREIADEVEDEDHLEEDKTKMIVQMETNHEIYMMEHVMHLDELLEDEVMMMKK